MKKKDWIVPPNGVNCGIYSFCSYRPSLGWHQMLESIISNKFQDITPRDSDTGVLAPPPESKLSLGKVPQCLQCSFKMLSLTSSLRPHLSLGCQLLPARQGWFWLHVGKTWDERGSQRSGCGPGRYFLAQTPELGTRSNSSPDHHGTLSVKEWQSYLSRSWRKGLFLIFVDMMSSFLS